MKYQKLQDMRIESQLTIKQVALYLNCHRDVYSRYEKGTREIPTDYLIRLAKYYDCTVDYLLGVSSEKRHFGE